MRRWLGLFLALGFLISCAHQFRAPKAARANIRGADLEYSVIGKGQPVLLIHGSIFADPYQPILQDPALERYKLITYHRRGFAGSDRAIAPFTIQQQAADAHALLQHLGIRRAHVVGHSYGAVIGLQLALDHPEAVASLSLLEPPIFNESPSAGKLSDEIGEAIARYQARDNRGAIERFVAIVGGNEFRSFLARNVGATAFDTAVTDAPTFFEVELPALQAWNFDFQSLSALRTPVFLVVGQQSREAFLEAVEALRRRLPSAEHMIVPDATHALQMMNPEPVAQGLAGFFQRHSLAPQ